LAKKEKLSGATIETLGENGNSSGVKKSPIGR
jgi:hypothetical protein